MVTGKKSVEGKMHRLELEDRGPLRPSRPPPANTVGQRDVYCCLLVAQVRQTRERLERRLKALKPSPSSSKGKQIEALQAAIQRDFWKDVQTILDADDSDALLARLKNDRVLHSETLEQVLG
jgi:hypothetical protein